MKPRIIINKINYHFTSFIMIAVLAVSCTERIDIKLKSSDIKLIVYGAITTDTVAHRIELTQSADYYSNKPPKSISGATLSISDGENTFPLTESTVEPGVYFTQPDVYGIPGETYTLNISNVLLDGSTQAQSYEATTYIPSLPDNYQYDYLDSIKVVYNKDWEGWEVDGWANEPADQKNYYLFKVYINDVLYSDSLNNLIISDDKLINGNPSNGAAFYFIQEPDTLKPGYKVTLELCIINEDYYQFLREAQISSEPQIPIFSSPPANVYTNISNGAFGCFAAYAILRSSYIIKEEDVMMIGK